RSRHGVCRAARRGGSWPMALRHLAWEALSNADYHGTAVGAWRPRTIERRDVPGRIARSYWKQAETEARRTTVRQNEDPGSHAPRTELAIGGPPSDNPVDYRFSLQECAMSNPYAPPKAVVHDVISADQGVVPA